MKTFLYATDCSKSSVSALKYAYKLSLSVNADLHVLHVFDLLPRVSAKVGSRKVLIDNFKSEQEELLRKHCLGYLEEEFGEPHITYHAVKGDSVTNAILETANSIEAELVIIGATSAGSLRGLFSENIGDELMPRLNATLLVLPQYNYFHGFSTFLYATDFEEADLIGLEKLVEIARLFVAKIEILHIPRMYEDDSERKMQWFKKMALERISYPEISFLLEYAEDVESGLHSHIKESNPEVLAMMERPKTSFWDKIFHRDLVQTMGHEISIPLMVFNKGHMVDVEKSRFKTALV